MTARTEPTATPTLRMTPLERAMGRFMRAPDHGADGGGASGGDGGGGDAAATDGAAGSDGAAGGDLDAGADVSLMGAAGAEAGAGADKGEGEAGDGKAGDGDGQPPAQDGPPEAYELSLPEGIELDADLLNEATPVFKELGLSNDAANKLAPLAMKVQERFVAQQSNDYALLRADWAKQVQSDPEIGGKNLSATMHSVARALDWAVGPAESTNDKGEKVAEPFRQLLNETGLGNHPVMVRAFAKIGAALGEDDKFVRENIGSPQKRDRLEALYPDDVPNKK